MPLRIGASARLNLNLDLVDLVTRFTRANRGHLHAWAHHDAMRFDAEMPQCTIPLRCTREALKTASAGDDVHVEHKNEVRRRRGESEVPQGVDGIRLLGARPTTAEDEVGAGVPSSCVLFQHAHQRGDVGFGAPLPILQQNCGDDA